MSASDAVYGSSTRRVSAMGWGYRGAANLALFAAAQESESGGVRQIRSAFYALRASAPSIIATEFGKP
jgi:hypothetical protein